MKQNVHTKMFALTLTTALALTALTACGNSAGTAALPKTSGTSTPLLEESGGTVGTVLLSVNPEIEMDYNDVGNVVALTGRNQEAQTLLASYTGYQGRPCTQVVGELVDEINALGYFDATVGGHEKNIILKLERGSAYPNDQFLNELAEAVRLVVETDQIGSQAVTLDQDDYDDTDYGPNADGITDYDDTDYGPNADGITDYDDTDYGPNADGITDYDDTDYGPNADGITDYDDWGDDDDWYGDPTGEDHWDDDDDGWDDTDYDDRDDDDDWDDDWDD